VELLQHPRSIDVTAATTGGYNGDCDVAYQGATVDDRPIPGRVWQRALDVDGRMVVHLINLVGQADAEWDAERKTPVVVAHGMLRVRRVRSNPPRVRVADPDHQSHLVELETRTDGDHVTALLPPLNVWQMVVIDF
jgi:hypothetical protein